MDFSSHLQALLILCRGNPRLLFKDFRKIIGILITHHFRYLIEFQLRITHFLFRILYTHFQQVLSNCKPVCFLNTVERYVGVR